MLRVIAAFQRNHRIVLHCKKVGFPLELVGQDAEVAMKPYLSHHTALGYWREHFPLDSELGLPARVEGLEMCASRKSDVAGSIPEEFVNPDLPIDVLIFDERERRRSRGVRCHTWKTALPTNAFFGARGVYVSSPEFVFLQLANELTIAQLVALGCELCGTYVLLPRGVTHPGALDESPKRLSPLTSGDKLREFVDALGKANGKAKAKRALLSIRLHLHSSRTFLTLIFPGIRAL